MSKTRAERVLFLKALDIVEGWGEIQIPNDYRPYINWPEAVTHQGRVYRFHRGKTTRLPAEYLRMDDVQELQNVVMTE